MSVKEVLALGIGRCAPSSWAPFFSLDQDWKGHVQGRQSRGPSGLRTVKGQLSVNTRQVLNPEQSQDEDDNVVVTDDSEKQLEDEEVLAIEGQGRVGRHMVSNGEVRLPGTRGHPQDKTSDSEDNKNSESEEESNEEESDEEDRDGDVDPGFREQLMAVLQAGKALVSRSCGGAPVPVYAFLCLREPRPLTGHLFLRVEWTMRMMRKRWGMRP